MQLSEHFSLEQLIFSDIAIRKGIDNTPTEGAIESLRLLCEHILEPLQCKIITPISIISGYRSKLVHLAHGGFYRITDHIYGQAVDIKVEGIDAKDLWRNIILGVYGNFEYYQIIYELQSWVHICYKPVDIGNKLIVSSHRDSNGRVVRNLHLYKEIENSVR